MFKKEKITYEVKPFKDSETECYINYYYDGILFLEDVIVHKSDVQAHAKMIFGNIVNVVVDRHGTYKKLFIVKNVGLPDFPNYTINVIPFYEYNGKTYILGDETSYEYFYKEDEVNQGLETCVEKSRAQKRTVVPYEYAYYLDFRHPDVVEAMIKNHKMESLHDAIKRQILFETDNEETFTRSMCDGGGRFVDIPNWQRICVDFLPKSAGGYWMNCFCVYSIPRRYDSYGFTVDLNNKKLPFDETVETLVPYIIFSKENFMKDYLNIQGFLRDSNIYPPHIVDFPDYPPKKRGKKRERQKTE